MDQAKDPHFQLYKAKSGDFYFRLIGANGEIMATSEGYPSKSHAKRAVARLCELFQPAGKKSLHAEKLEEVKL